jgi:hypothetical protein
MNWQFEGYQYRIPMYREPVRLRADSNKRDN